jgi:hypothetical protein
MPRHATHRHHITKAALEEIGYATYHGFEPAQKPGDCIVWCDLMDRKKTGRGLPLAKKDFDEVLGHVQVASDTPSICLAEELIKAYPEAKIIVNHRPNMNAWMDSIASVVQRDESFIGMFKKALIIFSFSSQLFCLAQHLNRINFGALWRKKNVVENSLTTTYKEHICTYNSTVTIGEKFDMVGERWLGTAL